MLSDSPEVKGRSGELNRELPKSWSSVATSISPLACSSPKEPGEMLAPGHAPRSRSPY